MTGLLVIKTDLHLASVSFNEGKIVDADANGRNGTMAFREIIEINNGTFEFSTTETNSPLSSMFRATPIFCWMC